MAHRLQLGLTSEYERFNGGTAYIEGSTAENPQAVMMFLNLPNHRSVERIESSMSDKAQLAEAKRIIHAANNYDALRAQNAQLLAALKSAKTQLEKYELEISGEMYNDPELNALIAAAESEKQ